MPPPGIAQIEAAVTGQGLLLMGGLAAEDGGSVILLGTGAAFWPVFSASSEALDGDPDPVDRWSLRVVGALARTLGATPRYPFGGPPYEPFIAWAKASGRCFSSPTGMLVHDSVGMMISFRGALHFEQAIDDLPTGGASPCTTCAAPCASACPVGALSADAAYDVAACHAFLDTDAGAECRLRGCRARRACPVSAGAGRTDAQSALHMSAFHRS